MESELLDELRLQLNPIQVALNAYQVRGLDCL